MAFIYNIICIPVAAGLLYPVLGIKLEPVMGAAAMSLSSVFVCLNALRLRRFRMEDKPALVTASVAEENMVVPALRAEKIEKNVQNVQQVRKEENKMEKTLKIEGMMCAHCQKHVTEALSAMDGVTEVVVDLNGGKAEVKTVCDISQEKFKKVIEEAGYELID